jgi:hypothetical protein
MGTVTIEWPDGHSCVWVEDEQPPVDLFAPELEGEITTASAETILRRPVILVWGKGVRTDRNNQLKGLIREPIPEIFGPVVIIEGFNGSTA